MSVCTSVHLTVNLNSVQRSSSDSTQMLPPRLSTIIFEIESPMPLPQAFILICFWSIPNLLQIYETYTYLNNFGMSLWLIPTPVSLTVNPSTVSLSCSNRSTATVMEPRSVNLTEFEIKLISTCLIRFESAANVVPAKSGSQAISNRRCRSTHWNPNRKSSSVRSEESLNSVSVSLNIFALNFAMSKMSSMRFTSSIDEISPIWMNLSNLTKRGWHCEFASWYFVSFFFISFTIIFDSFKELMIAFRGVLISCDKLVNINNWYSLLALSSSSFLTYKRLISILITESK